MKLLIVFVIFFFLYFAQSINVKKNMDCSHPSTYSEYKLEKHSSLKKSLFYEVTQLFKYFTEITAIGPYYCKQAKYYWHNFRNWTRGDYF